MHNFNRIASGFRNRNRVGEIVSCIRQTRQWPRLILAYLIRTGLPYPFQFATRGQFRLVLDNWDDLTTMWHVYFADEYHLPRESKTIVDLGANIGAFTVWAAGRCPNSKLFSFEPFPSTFEALESNVQLNGLGERVVCIQGAVTKYDGTGRFEAKPSKRSYCRRLLADEFAEGTIEVECITLETLLDRFALEEVDCLKMDVEGSEYDIILSSSPETLRRAKVITLEYHEGERSSVLWEKLEQSGFCRVMFAPNGWSGVAAFERIR